MHACIRTPHLNATPTTGLTRITVQAMCRAGTHTPAATLCTMNINTPGKGTACPRTLRLQLLAAALYKTQGVMLDAQSATTTSSLKRLRHSWPCRHRSSVTAVQERHQHQQRDTKQEMPRPPRQQQCCSRPEKHVIAVQPQLGLAARLVSPPELQMPLCC